MKQASKFSCFHVKVFLILIFTFIQLSLAMLGPECTGDNLFSHILSQVKNNVADSEKQIKEKVAERDRNHQKSNESTSLGKFASKLLDSTKIATGIITQSIKDTTSGITKTLLSGAINKGVSLLLKEFNLISRATGIANKLPLPNIETSAFSYNIKATGGRFSGLSSLEKHGCINIDIESAKTSIIVVPVRLNQMKINYASLAITGFLVSSNGSFSADIEKNSITIRLKLGMNNSCALSVEKVTIDELDGIKVKLEGLGGKLTSLLNNFMISFLKGQVLYFIEKVVNETLKKILGNNSMICSNFISA